MVSSVELAAKEKQTLAKAELFGEPTNAAKNASQMQGTIVAEPSKEEQAKSLISQGPQMVTVSNEQTHCFDRHAHLRIKLAVKLVQVLDNNRGKVVVSRCRFKTTFN